MPHHNLANPNEAPQIQIGQRISERAMHDILKLLNDRSASDLAELDDNELQRFETLCENWRTLAEAERARRNSLPGSASGAE
jgi:hypothetical protein